VVRISGYIPSHASSALRLTRSALGEAHVLVLLDRFKKLRCELQLL
jgi:hypothetical protein